MKVNKNEGEEILKNLDWLIDIQEQYNSAHKSEKQIKAVDWAKHYVRHFFGMGTDNYMTDLYLEVKHLECFAEHITNHDDGNRSLEIRLRILDYIDSLIKYHDELVKEDMKNDES